jgi:tRNA dimethylallyltransferase
MEGVPDDAPGFRAVGYSEILAFLDGEMALDKAAREIKKKSRHYARRQLIWFRKEENTFWIEWKDENEEAVADSILKQIEKEESNDCEREPS